MLNRNKATKENLLAKKFYELENLEDAPFKMALTAYNALKRDASTTEDLYCFLIEDAMFSSIYATFFEHLLITLAQYPQHALQLIEKFEADSAEREQIIATQAQNHFNFIDNYGMCDGCTSCENHTDVSQLIEPYQKGDIDFFTELYIGMQTIQFTLEYIVYDLIPSEPEIISALNHGNIVKLRQTVYSYAQLKASEI